MEANRPLPGQAADDCSCCRLSTDEGEERFECSERLQIFTREEQQILKDIREVGRRARVLKAQIQQSLAESPGGSPANDTMQKELAGLRRLRAELERARVAAAEERMRRLGHA